MSNLLELFEAQVERTPEAIAVVVPPSLVNRPLTADRQPPTTPAPQSSAYEGDGREGVGDVSLAHDVSSETPLWVVQGEQTLTYRELNRRANQLAHYLQKLGVGPECRVGICVERSLDMIVGLLGILKAGGAYLPLDPDYPAERLAFMLADAQVPVLLTQERLLQKLLEPTAQVICLDSDWPLINQAPSDNLAVKVWPDNLAYVIYTSGSTGQPKGVMITQQAISNHMLWLQATFPLSKADRVLQKTPFGFDASVWEFYAPLLVGGQLVMAQPGGHQDSAYLVQVIADYQVTILQLVPTLLHMLLAEPGLERCTSLRRVFCGGEALPWEWQERFLARMGAELTNLYGPTEACIDATYWTCRPDDPQKIVPIGRPIANTQIYILDPSLQPVPVGTPGELYIGGVGLARGYLNRPDLTAERFIPNPFVQSRGAEEQGSGGDIFFQTPPPPSTPAPLRLYKTGDLVRFLPDGAIEFLGRIDHQVKIRGFRVELGEIEAVLRHHPAIRETVVLARSDKYGPGQKQLVAYLVTLPEDRPTASELRAYLKERLPEYMIPSRFVLLETLPLTPNGKVDRLALPSPDQARPSVTGKPFTAPRTQIEQILAEIWSEVLKIEQVGVGDNFFELGGDSILSIQIMARAHQAGLRLTPRQFFQHQTIAELAVVAEMAPVTSIGQGPVTGPVPLTPIQHGFFEQNFAEPQHWNQPLLLKSTQLLNPILLEQAFQHLLAHHDALRLRFYSPPSSPESGEEKEGDGWRQVNTGLGETISFSRLDLSALMVIEQKAAIEATAAELQASLNLTQGPLVRVALFELGPQASQRLLIAIHHLVVDGVSWRILLEDVQTAYQQLDRGEPVQLPAKTTSYQEWAERLVEEASQIFGNVEARPVGRTISEQRSYVPTGLAPTSELAYWLAEPPLPLPPLPVDLPEGRLANTEASGRIVWVSLGEEDTRALLQDVPAAYHTHINDILLTALAQAFAAWTGVPAMLLNLEGHGREEILAEVNLSRTVGWFTTIFPVYLDLREATQAGEAIKSIKEQLRRIPERGIGYGLLRYLSGKRSVVNQLRAQPQAEVSFNYLGQFDQVLAGSSLFRPAQESGGPERSPRARRSHLLEIEGSIIASRLRLSWTYSENIHRRATIERLAEDFIIALRTLIEHCQSPTAGGYTPSDFPEANLSQVELDGLLAEIGEVME